MQIIFDCETTGLPVTRGYDKYFPPEETKRYENARIVQIGYIILDGDKEVVSRSILVKPNGFVIPEEATRIHQISQERAMREGKEAKVVWAILAKELEKCDTFIAHNLLFDYNVLLAELYRHEKENLNLITALKNLKLYCTMKNGRQTFAFHKAPKLTELYKLCYPDGVWHQIHDALDDCRGCLLCYKRLRDLEKCTKNSTENK